MDRSRPDHRAPVRGERLNQPLALGRMVGFHPGEALPRRVPSASALRGYRVQLGVTARGSLVQVTVIDAAPQPRRCTVEVNEQRIFIVP